MNDLDFEWTRHRKGYQLIDSPALLRRESPPRSSLSTLTPAASGVILPNHHTGKRSAKSDQQIVPIGGAVERYRPLADYETLFEQFAKEAVDPQGALSFVNKFGPMTTAGLEQDVGDSVSLILENAKIMRRVLFAYMNDDKRVLAMLLARGVGLGAAEPARIELRLEFDLASQAPKLQFTLPNLLNALWLQLSQKITGTQKIRACLECMNLFEVGAGTGRRLDAKFCSDDHRYSFNSRRRTREK